MKHLFQSIFGLDDKILDSTWDHSVVVTGKIVINWETWQFIGIPHDFFMFMNAKIKKGTVAASTPKLAIKASRCCSARRTLKSKCLWGMDKNKNYRSKSFKSCKWRLKNKCFWATNHSRSKSFKSRTVYFL